MRQALVQKRIKYVRMHKVTIKSELESIRERLKTISMVTNGKRYYQGQKLLQMKCSKK